jgi:hypothetical protein
MTSYGFGYVSFFVPDSLAGLASVKSELFTIQSFYKV